MTLRRLALTGFLMTLAGALTMLVALCIPALFAHSPVFIYGFDTLVLGVLLWAMGADRTRKDIL